MASPNTSIQPYLLWGVGGIILAAAFISFFGSPSRGTSLPSPPVGEGTLLFVEDVDGEGGLMSGDFGDLVTLYPRTGGSHRLTSDDYYDTHPSWGPDGRYVLFESKRTQNPTRDMGAPSRIHKLNMSSGNVGPWGAHLVQRFEQVGREMEVPAVSPSGKKVAFATSPNGSRWAQVVVYDRTKDSVHVVTDELTFVDRIVWSEDGQSIGFSAVPRGVPVLQFVLFLYDTRSRDMQVLKKDNTSHSVCCFSGRKLMYKVIDDESFMATIKQAPASDLSNGQKVYDYAIDSGIRVRDPIYANDGHIYALFRGENTSGSNMESNICKLNIDSRGWSCLTSDPRVRGGLRVLR